jgi:hypothetical protein
MVDYTPSTGDVAAGQVVVLSTTAGTLQCMIAHHDIPNNTLGALASGGGVYEVTNNDNAAVDAKVYWDDTNNRATTTATSNALLGYVVSMGAGGAGTPCRVLHKSYT